MKGQFLTPEVIVEWLKDIDYVNSTRKELHSRIVVPAHAHAHLLHPRWTNQQPKNSLVCSPICEGKKRNTESTTSLTMTQRVFPHESSCLANCRFVRVSVHCYLRIFVQSVQEPLVFAPVASA